MMTFHPKTNPRNSQGISSGFTLLEIIIVLAITAVVLGGAISYLILSSSERALNNTSGEIELLAKKARTAAILHQTPYAIEFRPGSVRLLPLIESGKFDKTNILTNTGETTPHKTLREEIAIDSDISISIRHWNTSNFINPSETLIPVWRFDPDGLSEPISVRMTIENNYTQDTYNPLNATISDTESEIN
jgi:prepilin-type N-terminal cleavage/methylation domain-containing protein